jgi:hypothetical protein
VDKRDANEKEIVAFLRSMGCIVIRQDRHAGFDLLVIDLSGLYIVEIKNPATAWKLTEAEAELSRAVEGLGGQYHVIESVQGAAKLIGLDVVDGTKG